MTNALPTADALTLSSVHRYVGQAFQPDGPIVRLESLTYGPQDGLPMAATRAAWARSGSKAR
jgi:hypothetical protein